MWNVNESMPGHVVFIDEPELVKAIRARAPQAQIIILPIAVAEREGAAKTHRQRTHFDPKLASLTQRERDVLLHVATGETNAEIADAMGLARNTVKAYLQSLMRKLGARNRIEALAYARTYGCI